MTSDDRPRTICYLAESEDAAHDGADALERVPSGPERTARALSTDAVETLRECAADADCVVFAETPTSTAGANLLEAIEASGSTPLVLFTDASYPPSAARSTDGIDGYVRRDAADATAHLADEIEWVCACSPAGTAAATDDDTPTDDDVPAADDDTPTDDDVPAAVDPDDGDAPIPAPAASPDLAATRDGIAATLLEAVPDAAAADDREALFAMLVETAVEAVGAAGGWLSTVHFGEFTPRAAAGDVAVADVPPRPRAGVRDELLRSGDPLSIDDLRTDDRLDPPVEGARACRYAAVGDAGLLAVVADDQDAFGPAADTLLAAWGRFGGTVLERLETERGLRNDRERRQRERERIVDRRDELATERDRARALFASHPQPAVHYEVVEDQPVVRGVTDAFQATFGVAADAIVDRPMGAGVTVPGLGGRTDALVDALAADDRRRLRCRLETGDGVREFQVRLVPVDAGDPPAGLLVYDDVTRLVRHRRGRADAEQRLERMADLLEDEFRPPLNVARGYLEIAEATGEAEYFDEIDDAQETLLARLEQLVAIARRREGGPDAAPVSAEK